MWPPLSADALDRLKRYFVSLHIDPDRPIWRPRRGMPTRGIRPHLHRCRICKKLVASADGIEYQEPGVSRDYAIHEACIPDIPMDEAKRLAAELPDWERICRWIAYDDQTPPPAHIPGAEKFIATRTCTACKRVVKPYHGWCWFDLPAGHLIVMHRDCLSGASSDV